MGAKIGGADTFGVSYGLLLHSPSVSEWLFPCLCSAPGKRWVWGVSPGQPLDRVGENLSRASSCLHFR